MENTPVSCHQDERIRIRHFQIAAGYLPLSNAAPMIHMIRHLQPPVRSTPIRADSEFRARIAQQPPGALTSVADMLFFPSDSGSRIGRVLAIKAMKMPFSLPYKFVPFWVCANEAFSPVALRVPAIQRIGHQTCAGVDADIHGRRPANV
jgi:hypothetical protein